MFMPYIWVISFMTNRGHDYKARIVPIACRIGRYLESVISDVDPQTKILEFLDWEEPDKY